MTPDRDPLTVGFVGLGGMGHRHSRNVATLGHEVGGGADIVGSTRQTYADSFNVPVFADHEELYDTVEPDAIVIATPNAFHADATIAALERDIAVLIEKPLADNLEHAQAIADAAARTDATAMVGFHNRFCSAMRMLEEYRDEGEIGEIVHIEATFIRRRGIPNVNSWFTDESMAGGGALIDVGVHSLDFAMAAAGFPEPTCVTGVTRQLYAHRSDYVDPEQWNEWGAMGGEVIDVEDGATALVRCAGDVTISLEVAWASDRIPQELFRIQGTNGGAKCELGADRITFFGASSAGTDHFVDSEMVDPSGQASWKAEMEYFLETVESGAELESNTIEEALTVQEIIHGIYESAETGLEYRF